MTQDGPMACSLAAGDLEQRLAAIAEVGAESLLSSEAGDAGHTLRFRPQARGRLERIVAAEAECCPFLDLRLADEAEGPILTITAPEEGRAVADQLAQAFSGRAGHSPASALG